MKSKLSVFLILGLIGSISLTGILAPDKLFSAKEKRKLQQFPEFTIAGFWDKSYQKKMEKYTLDQFPNRNHWVQQKKVIDCMAGYQETGNVYLASDGYLIDCFRSYCPEQFEKNAKMLSLFAERIRTEFKLPVHAILVPTAAHIFKDKLPAGAPTADQPSMNARMRELGVPLVDVSAMLQNHSAEPLYYHTDHHYTSLGAWYCYQAWRMERGLPEANEKDWTKEILCENFYGTTYAKASLPWISPDTITAWYQNPSHPVTYNGSEQESSLYHRKALSGQDPYKVFLNSNQALSVIEGSGSSGKLLLIKDSFGNTFAQFPVEEFRQVHMIDPRFFGGNVEDYIRENGITEILFVYGMENFSQDLFLPAFLSEIQDS